MRSRVDAVFQALADPHRRFVLETLADQGSATATELAAALPVTRQAVAKHLVTLRAARRSSHCVPTCSIQPIASPRGSGRRR